MTGSATGGGVLVRAAAPHDAPELIGLIGELAAFHGDAASVSQEDLTEDLFGSDPWATALVATGDTGLVGYAIWVKIYNAQAARRGIDLHHLYVSEPARRCGIGRGLLDGLVDIARNLRCGFVRIGVNPENVDAQRFYLREGFVRQPVGGLRFRLDLRTR